MSTNTDEQQVTAAAPEAEEMSENITMEGLFAQQDDFRKKIFSGEIVKVKVIQIAKEYVLVDIGEKKEGLVPVADFGGEKNLPAVGSEVSVVMDRRGSDERHSILSHRKAAEMVGWDLAKTALDQKTRVKGSILEHVKGGYIVDVFGVRGFMPLSLSELHPAYKHHLPVGAKIRCQIIEIVREKRRLIVSRKQVLLEDENARRDKVLADVKVGDVLRVVVSKVGKDCLFLRFHGIEGVVRLENVAWRKPEEALNTYRRGQRLRAKLVALDKEAPKMDFGLKQLYSNPADLLRKKYQVRSMIKGKVVSVGDAGITVSVAPDVDGIIAVTEYSQDFNPNPGDPISAVVIGVDSRNYRLNLSMKRYEDLQNRKIMAHYLREAPPLTLGQLLRGNDED